MLFTGLSQGIQPIVSYNYGIKNLKRVRDTFIFAHKVCFITSIASLLFVIFFSGSVARIFTHEPDLIAECAKGFILYSIAISFLGFNFVNIAYLQAVDNPMVSNIICMARSFCCIYSFSYITRFNRKIIWFKTDGIWVSLPFADFITAILTVPF